MPIQSSFATVAEQVAAFNKNMVEILAKLNSLSTTTDSSVEVRIFNDAGVITTYTLPSFTYLKGEIDRLNNSINSLYSIDTNGALIQTSSQNQFKKIITVDLNREPNSINELGSVTSFKSNKNWFFEGLLNPQLSIEFDLGDKIENNVRKCLSRRYIIFFEKDGNGNYTPSGQSAINSFNTLFKQKSNIDVQEFENWYRTTPGVLNSSDPVYDEQIFDIEPNVLLYDGLFNVIKMEEDSLNKKLWYHLNTLDFVINETNEVRQLSMGDFLIINQAVSNTKYKIIEISTTESNPRVRFERVEGLQPIPVGIGTLKMYSPVIYVKKVKITVGYDERNVIYVKPMNTENNLLSKSWSKGTAFYTNDLRLVSTAPDNGQSMEQYYIDQVNDYGQVLKDLVAKKIPNNLGATPTIVTLNPDNFKVVQINKHLTDSADENLLKTKHNYTVSLKNEIKQIQEAIDDRNKKLRATRFTSTAEKNKFELEITELGNKKNSKSKLLSTTVQEIIDLSKSNLTKIEPIYHARGFWNIPSAIVTKGTQPQEVVQFRIQYRYLSKDGKEPQVDTFTILNNQNQNTTVSFSNWVEYKSGVRQRIYNKVDGGYTWADENLESSDVPNINQLDLLIKEGERIEIRVKSVSEVGWPESPIESDWSEILPIDFPDSLNNILADNQFIEKEADKEDVKSTVFSELTSRGLDTHLSETTVINNKNFYHTSETILSGFKDNNSVSLSLYEYLQKLEDRVKTLEEKILRTKGELQIVLVRTNQEFVIGNNSETIFNIECEDYLEEFTGVGIPSGRVYANNIYVIKDFALRVKNKSTESPLGLLSNRSYLSNSVVYNNQVPQTFWVNNHDELLFTDVSGISRTQIDNQFIWSVNYDNVSQTRVTKLSSNIGNNFKSVGDNSLTSVLSSSSFNLGYKENKPLSFISNNNSLLDPSKWIDSSISVGSTTKFLTSIHPVINDLKKISETNEDKIKSMKGGDEMIIPINIYFKLNSLNTKKKGRDYQYVDLNNTTKTVKHIKKLTFMLENEAENKPFVFKIIFNLNRNKVTFASKPKNYNTIVK